MPPVTSVTSVAELVYGGLCPGMNTWSLLQRTLCRAIHWPPWFQCLGSSCNMTCDGDAGKSARVLETVEAVANQKNLRQNAFCQAMWMSVHIHHEANFSTMSWCHLSHWFVNSVPGVLHSPFQVFFSLPHLDLASFLGRWNWRGTSWSTGRLGGRGATWGCNSTEHLGYSLVMSGILWQFKLILWCIFKGCRPCRRPRKNRLAVKQLRKNHLPAGKHHASEGRASSKTAPKNSLTCRLKS